jgi:hypothetical protein
MPRFLRLGNVWINVEQIIEVHAEQPEGRPAQCRIRLPGETAVILEGDNMTKLLNYLQGNETR